MGCAHICLYFLLPLLVFAYTEDFGPYKINGLTMVYKGVYVYAKPELSILSWKNDPFIQIDLTITHPTGIDTPIPDIEVMVMTDQAFRSLGYEAGKDDSRMKRVVCCDSFAFNQGGCGNPGHLFLKDVSKDDIFIKSVKLQANKEDISITFEDVETTGIYFIVVSSCDYRIFNAMVTGKYTVMNPYGHLPAMEYGYYPFTVICLFCYAAMFVFWAVRMRKYEKEVSNIQYIVLVALLAFLLYSLINTIYLQRYNSTGYSLTLLYVLIILVLAAAKTLTRVLVLIISMGYGIIYNNMSSTNNNYTILYAVVYYCVYIWDAFTKESILEYSIWKLSIFSVMDALLYFFIYKSLTETINLLIKNKQSMKLTLFQRMRRMILMSILIIVIIFFITYLLVFRKYIVKLWSIQCYNEGIFNVFYIALYATILSILKPDEHSSDYTDRIELSTEEKENDEDYGIRTNVLQEGEQEEIKVQTVTEELKPMSMY